MSSDTGVYVLKTKADPKSIAPFEYRVAQAGAIENIYWDDETGNYRNDGKFIPEIAYEYFGSAPVFSKEREALEQAGEEAANCILLEYGIQVLDHGDQEFQYFSPKEMETFYSRAEALMEERRQKSQLELEKNLAERTLTLEQGTYVEVSGRVAFFPPDADPDHSETYKLLQGRLEGRVKVELLNDAKVVVDE